VHEVGHEEADELEEEGDEGVGNEDDDVADGEVFDYQAVQSSGVEGGDGGGGEVGWGCVELSGLVRLETGQTRFTDKMN
jgi:hypothetical protein